MTRPRIEATKGIAQDSSTNGQHLKVGMPSSSFCRNHHNRLWHLRILFPAQEGMKRHTKGMPGAPPNVGLLVSRNADKQKAQKFCQILLFEEHLCPRLFEVCTKWEAAPCNCSRHSQGSWILLVRSEIQCTKKQFACWHTGQVMRCELRRLQDSNQPILGVGPQMPLADQEGSTFFSPDLLHPLPHHDPTAAP